MNNLFFGKIVWQLLIFEKLRHVWNVWNFFYLPRCNHAKFFICVQNCFFLFTFQLNVAAIDVDVVDVAFEAELVAVGGGDRVLNECLFVDYSLNCLVAMTFPPVGIWWLYQSSKVQKFKNVHNTLKFSLTLSRLFSDNMKLARAEKLRLRDCCFSH